MFNHNSYRYTFCSLILFLFACTTYVGGSPLPPDPPERPFETIEGEELTETETGSRTKIRDAKGQVWIIAAKEDSGIGMRNVATGSTYVESWDGDKLTGTLKAHGETWTSTTWRGDKGLKSLQLRGWSQRLDAASYVTATSLALADGDGSRSAVGGVAGAAAEDCYNSAKKYCGKATAAVGSKRNCQVVAAACRIAGSRHPLGWALRRQVFWACNTACRGAAYLTKEYVCPAASDLLCGTEDGKTPEPGTDKPSEPTKPGETGCNPNNASCDGTLGDPDDSEDDNIPPTPTPNPEPNDGTLGDPDDSEDDSIDPNDERPPNGDPDDGGDDPYEEPAPNGDPDDSEDDNIPPAIPGDYDGDGEPYNGEDGDPGELDDYSAEDGDPDDSEDDDLPSDDPAGLDSGSGNGAGDGTDGDVGNGEDNGV